MVCLQKSRMKEFFKIQLLKNQLFNYGLKNMQPFAILKKPFERSLIKHLMSCSIG